MNLKELQIINIEIETKLGVFIKVAFFYTVFDESDTTKLSNLLQT
jgi:hypothetical protein